MTTTQHAMLETIGTLRADVDGTQPMLRNERNAALRLLAGLEGLIRADAETASRISVYSLVE